MARLSHKDERRAAEVIAAIGERAPRGPGAVETALPLLRELMELDCTCAYRIGAAQGGGDSADFMKLSGLRYSAAEAQRRVDGFFHRMSERRGLWDPIRPQRHQQNRALILPTHKLCKASDPGDVQAVLSPLARRLGIGQHAVSQAAETVWELEAALRVLGLSGHDQVRALLCDGGTLLAWVGGFTPKPGAERQRLLLRRALEPLREQLIVERQTEAGGLEHAAVVAALEHIPAAAFVLDAAARVVHANAVGRHRLAVEQDTLRRALMQVVKAERAGAALAVTRLAGPGMPVRFLAIARSPGDRVRVGVERAKARWRLTTREVEVLSELAAGRGNRDIADRLAAAPRTVELHISAILHKAHADSRSQLIIGLWSLADAG